MCTTLCSRCMMYVAVCCNVTIFLDVLLRVAACYSVLQRVTACCSVLRCVAMCCDVLQCIEYSFHEIMSPREPVSVLSHCNTLQHTAAHRNTCNTLQHTATHCNTLQHTATHYNTLQHTATHCNTLQHTVTDEEKEPALDSTAAFTALVTSLQQAATHCNTLQHTTTDEEKEPSLDARSVLTTTFPFLRRCHILQVFLPFKCVHRTSLQYKRSLQVCTRALSRVYGLRLYYGVATMSRFLKISLQNIVSLIGFFHVYMCSFQCIWAPFILWGGYD